MSNVTILVLIVVAAIIVLQSYFFHKNHKRMEEFKNIFSKEARSSLNIFHDTDGFVNGIIGTGNNIFGEIKSSINEYLRHNKGSVIDFHLIKDAIDRHYDAVDEDINAQMPVPLYCGLAGTMLGVIIGLASLIFTNGLTSMMGGSNGSLPVEGQTVYVSDSGILSGKPTEVYVQGINESNGYTVSYENANGSKIEQDFTISELQQAKSNAASNTAANGITDLLWGVALAMIASVFGIFLTTLNSLRFKAYKLQAEKGKNSFLSWLQSTLLPELPQNTGESISQLIEGLKRFNNTFSTNIVTLSQTFDKVNESYGVHAEIIQNVHDMDVPRIARANVKVLQELQASTDMLESFNSYLSKIDEFNFQFSKQAETQTIFKNISDYFNRSKAYLSKDVDSTDEALNKALKKLNDTSTEEIINLQNNILEMTDKFNKMISDQQESFDKISKSIQSQFEANISDTPKIAEKLAEISAIPSRLDKLVSAINTSNERLLSTVRNLMINSKPTELGVVAEPPKGNKWLRIAAFSCLGIITACCVFFTAMQVISFLYN